MAARNRIWTPEIVRERIRTSMLVDRLQKHVLGKCKMSTTQVQAAMGLLKKVLPDTIASSITLTTIEKRLTYAERLAQERAADPPAETSVVDTVQ